VTVIRLLVMLAFHVNEANSLRFFSFHCEPCQCCLQPCKHRRHQTILPHPVLSDT